MEENEYHVVFDDKGAMAIKLACRPNNGDTINFEGNTYTIVGVYHFAETSTSSIYSKPSVKYYANTID